MDDCWWHQLTQLQALIDRVNLGIVSPEKQPARMHNDEKHNTWKTQLAIPIPPSASTHTANA
jgi:hypothetical protein